MRRLVDTSRRLLGPALVICMLGGASPAVASSETATAEPCRRTASTPEHIFYNDDSRPDEIHAAGGAMYCPNYVWVQVTVCVQRQTDTGWADVGCETSPRTRITPQTPGGRGQAVSFEVPCVTGVVRTHVTGGEGLEPTEWNSHAVMITCFVDDNPADTTAPQTSILWGPPSPTDDSSPSFVFSASEPGSTFECRLDDGTWESCTSPVAFTLLADGDHGFEVRATDAAGNTDASPAGWSFTIDTTPPPPVDTTAPETSILSGPSGPTAETSPSFAFSASDPGSTFEYRLDDRPWESCISPAAFTALAHGDHRFEVRATDAAGNTDASPATHSFTVDTSQPPPPEPGPVTGGPASAQSGPGLAADTTGPAVVIPATNRAIRATSGGTVRFPIGPFAESAAGVLSLVSHARKLSARWFRVLAGHMVTVRVRLNRRGRGLLGSRGHLRVRATVIVRDAAGNATVTHFRFMLHAHLC